VLLKCSAGLSQNLQINGSRNITVGIPTRVRARFPMNRGSNVCNVKNIFFAKGYSLLWPNQACCSKGIGGPSPGTKLPRSESDTSPPPRAEVKNGWRYIYSETYASISCTQETLPSHSS